MRQVHPVGVEPLPLTMNPKVVPADGARRPFQLSLATLIVDPAGVGRPPQSWPSVCPLARVNWTFQPLVVVDPVLVTVTSP